MNKKLLTLAVAAAMAVPAVASAEAILYGKVNVSLDWIDVDQNATFFRPGSSTSPSLSMSKLLGTGTNVTGSLGYFSPVPDANNNLVPLTGLSSTNLTNNGSAAYTAAYNAALANNPTNVAAAQAAGAAARALYSTTGIAPYSSTTTAAPNAAVQLQNISDAQIAAFTTVGGTAGTTSLQNYYDFQTALLEQNLAAGRISSAVYDSQLAQLNGLVDVAAGAAARGAITAGQKYKGWGMDQGWQGPADRIGVKGSEDLGNGLKAIYQVELSVDITNASRDSNMTNGNRANGFAFRNTFVGLAGNWGTALIGRHDTPLKVSTGKLDLFSDTLADYNNTIGFQDLRVDNAVAYISPSWSGFQFMAATVPGSGTSTNGVFNADNDSVGSSYSLAAIYKNGPFYGSVAYEALESENFAWDNSNYELLYGAGKVAENDSKWRVGLGLLDWNGFTLTGIYEDRQHILGAPEDADGNFFQIQAGYAFGNNMVKAMWGRADLNRCADPNGVGFRYTCPSSALGAYFEDSVLVQNNEKSSWAVGYDYNFSKRTLAYALYTEVDDTNEDADWSGFSIGMMHSF